MLKYYILFILCALFIVPNNRVDAAPISDELKMLIEISNNISSVKTELHNVDIKFTTVKNDFSNLNKSMEVLSSKIVKIEEWKETVNEKLSDLKTLNNKLSELDKLNSVIDVKTSIYISVVGFILSVVTTILIGNFLAKRKK